MGKIYRLFVVTYHQIIPVFSDGNGREIIIGKNQMTSDNNGVCASSWLRVMLSDQILVSRITSKYVT